MRTSRLPAVTEASGRYGLAVTRRRAKPLLGTLVDITVFSRDRDGGDLDVLQVDVAISAAFAEVAAVHRLMSFHDAHSDLTRINRAGVGLAVEVDTRTAEVLQAAQKAAGESQGLFDCTVAGELIADGLLPAVAGRMKECAGPSEAFSQSMRWRITGTVCVKLAPCLLDLGGIAKGYAVDRAIAVLQEHGIRNAVVNAGGDLRHIGNFAQVIHLRDAVEPRSLPLALNLQGQALASSACGGLTPDGAGSRASIYDGASRTPVALGAHAAILAPTCMDADLLTKVVLASGDPRHPMLQARGARTVHYSLPSCP